MLTGTIIKESLKDESVLRSLRTSNMHIADIDNAASDQPTRWTLLSFEVSDEEGDTTAKTFAAVLREGTWYINMHNDKRCYIVFANRIFTYEKGDKSGRAEAEAYGRSLGIPEEQLDWSE